MNNTPTWETDAHENNMCRFEFDEELAMTYSLARKLERERDEARNEIIGWRNKWNCAVEMAARAENALDETRKNANEPRHPQSTRTMNDTPTPETIEEWRKPMSDDAKGKRMFHHACKLERERDEAIAARKQSAAEWADQIQNADLRVTRAKRERDDAQNEIIGWRIKLNCSIEMGDRAENALDEMTLRWERTNDALFAERALADRLATVLRSTHWHRQAALDAWEEARK
jgi:hypothetical protein